MSYLTIYRGECGKCRRLMLPANPVNSVCILNNISVKIEIDTFTVYTKCEMQSTHCFIVS